MLIIKLENTTSAFLQVYAPNEQSEYPAFLQKVKAAKPDYFILTGEFNAHVDNDAETWRGVTGRKGLSALNPIRELLLDFCCAHGMAITNTFFQYKDIHNYTSYQDALKQRSAVFFRRDEYPLSLE